MWSLLKDALSKRPKSSLGLGLTDKSINTFKEAIREEWFRIPQNAIDNSIISMPKRYKAIIDAKGWYTKY